MLKLNVAGMVGVWYLSVSAGTAGLSHCGGVSGHDRSGHCGQRGGAGTGAGSDAGGVVR